MLDQWRCCSHVPTLEHSDHHCFPFDFFLWGIDILTCTSCRKRVNKKRFQKDFNSIILIAKDVLQYKYFWFTVKKLQLPFGILSELGKQTNDLILILFYIPMKQTTDLEQAAC